MAAGTVTEPETRARVKLGRRWNVVLLDDDEHTYEYVVEMLGDLFGHSTATAFEMAVEVDSTGRVIVWTGHREQAEHKVEKIHAYGADPRIPRCKGSMSAVIELLD